MLDRVDKPLFITILILLISGLVFFGSASLGVLSLNEVKFYSIIKTQLIYALGGGAIALYIGIKIPISFYQKYAYYIFGGALFLTSLVFVPGLSRYHGGAHRWIDLGTISFQPSEVLKFATIVFVAMWCAKYRNYFKDWRYGFLSYLIIIFLISILLLLQPDFGTYLVIILSSFIIYFVSGARKKHIYTFFIIGIIGTVLLISFRPYMLERVKTFFNNEQDKRGSSWQVNQSLIALGGGGFLGRGLGQSVQKFNYLPEPIGDSIFAVIGEEVGFLGVLFMLTLYGIVGIRGYVISKNANNQFGRLIAVGVTSIILIQATLNMGSMLGLLPLTGVPLPLVSHGGTALVVVLFEIGVLLNISKFNYNHV